jgi:hypothetical protein
VRIISLWQPWASLMALNEKRIETRSWGTRYRGELAIASTLKFDKDARALCRVMPFRLALERHGITDPEQLPLGAILCRTMLRGVLPTSDFVLAGMPKISEFKRHHAAEFDPDFGDYRPDRRAWICDETQACRDPIPYAGAQGIRELPLEIADLVRSLTSA